MFLFLIVLAMLFFLVAIPIGVGRGLKKVRETNDWADDLWSATRTPR